MKKVKSKLGTQKHFIKKLATEDMRYLQKKITGRSVHKKRAMEYFRKPKHKHELYQYYY